MAEGGPTPIESYVETHSKLKRQKINSRLRNDPDYRENYGL